MAEKPTRARDGQTQPVIQDDSTLIKDDFWAEVERLKKLLDECREILDDLRGGPP